MARLAEKELCRCGNDKEKRLVKTSVVKKDEIFILSQA